MKDFFAGIFRACYRARVAILCVGLAYLGSVIAGIVMVHAGNAFAISYRDQLVSQAQSSPALTALGENSRLPAALLDFAGNLLGAIGTTLGGPGVVFPFPLILYRGWVGGIVSVDSMHASRLAQPAEAAYYVSTLVLQLIPYTLAGGAGVNMGFAYFRPQPAYQGEKWLLGIPKESVRDALRIYVLVIPLFLFASLWEFFLR